MTGLDTNILLRFLLDDDPKQTARATRVIEACTADQPGYINLVTLAEVAWVMSRALRLTKYQIADSLEILLQADTLRIQNEREAFLAVTALREGASSFADALIALLNKKAGCTTTLTFDIKASRLQGFTQL